MIPVRSLFCRIASSSYKISLRSISCSHSRMSHIKRDLDNETTNDECLSQYTHFFNPDLLKGKTALITGGGSGIGFRIAEVFMRHGCDCAIASRNYTRVEAQAEKLMKATNGRCLALGVDVRHPKEIETGVNKMMNEWKKIDILVNCAAGNFLAPIESLSYNAFKTVMDIDTMGTFNTSKAVYDHYFKANGGNIINISATLHYKGRVMQCHAGSAKAAIDAMTKHMAVEWGEKGIRVNGIAPGPIGGTVGMEKLGGKTELAEKMKRIKCTSCTKASCISTRAAACSSTYT